MVWGDIAAVSYLNTVPFIYGIASADNLRARLLLSPPSGCARTLAEGKADIALVPVAAIPSIPDIDIVTPWCIGASGSVRTVVVLSNEPWERVRRVWLDTHSMTSVQLVRVLARERWGVDPEWMPLDDYTLLGRPAAGDAFLIIGDKVFGWEERFAYKYDLADEWRAMTGLPFVFAAWVARRGTPAPAVAELDEALAYGVRHIDEAIRHYGHADKPYAHDYLTRNIDFAFDGPKRRALSLFWGKGQKIPPAENPG
ncbi:MAG: menaquinone biosynthesis protein [Rikenellaceae bacterium]|nr:menaquinone biosynthesis protein [Rikenellaceae bacterium]